MENSSENGDGAYSPSVWLVTPLISKLQQEVLGRVLKCAGQVLGQGQWWNPDKSQEKRRSTRATRFATVVYTVLFVGIARVYPSFSRAKLSILQ